ncbi:MAG: sugar phosphate isomerase/epimerase [Verrucomicrobiales bacterium]|nr:sugar phosphate isomerase/epimerase [Verrucomicrobiales bacterium]
MHTFTNKPWSIHECIEHYARRGIGGISIWRETLAGHDLAKVRQHLTDAGLQPVSLVRGGFFTGLTAEAREKAITSNLAALAECEALGIDKIVLVCGATVGQSPQVNRAQIAEGIARIAPRAQEIGVRLLIEPLHPVYAGDRSAICSLRDANDLCAELALPNLGIAFDVYHVWHEMDLEAQIQRCAAGGWLDTYHICDFKPDQDHLLLDRGLMGEGCIPLKQIDDWIHTTGFTGHREVEIFSRKWWAEDQHRYLDRIVESTRQIYG